MSDRSTASNATHASRSFSRRRWIGSCAAGLLGLGAAWHGDARSLLAGQRWYDEQTLGPIQIHANFSLTPFQPLLDEVAQLQQSLQVHLEAPPAREPIHVFLFDRKPVYLAYLREYFPRVPYRRALYIKERGPGMVLAFRSPEFDVDLRHETTHALLHTGVDDLPLWLDEGLAEYFELPADQRAGGNPYLAQVQWQATLKQVPHLETLDAIQDLEHMGKDEYRAAWAWVHFLLHGAPGGRIELIRYLADLRSGVDAERLSTRLARRMPDRESQFLQHFKQFKT
ncbi:MAG: hypothetical protein U0939_23155 [Pirellulales bacterium]